MGGSFKLQRRGLKVARVRPALPFIVLIVLENDAANGRTCETTEYKLSRAILRDLRFASYLGFQLHTLPDAFSPAKKTFVTCFFSMKLLYITHQLAEGIHSEFVFPKFRLLKAEDVFLLHMTLWSTIRLSSLEMQLVRDVGR